MPLEKGVGAYNKKHAAEHQADAMSEEEASKFTLDTIGREDLGALSREAAQISGIPHVMDVDREEVDGILGAEPV